MKSEKQIIGLNDVIDLPEADIFEIPCKIDTGAYNCSIDCSRFKLIEVDGEKVLRFTLLGKDYDQYSGKTLETKNFIQKKVKSSSGHAQYRYQVSLEIRIFDTLYPATFNLSKRHNMRYPILLGRKFLAKRFVVDVSKRNLSHKARNK